MCGRGKGEEKRVSKKRVWEKKRGGERRKGNGEKKV
jgi:hypothetical protein